MTPSWTWFIPLVVLVLFAVISLVLPFAMTQSPAAGHPRRTATENTEQTSSWRLRSTIFTLFVPLVLCLALWGYGTWNPAAESATTKAAAAATAGAGVLIGLVLVLAQTIEISTDPVSDRIRGTSLLRLLGRHNYQLNLTAWALSFMGFAGLVLDQDMSLGVLCAGVAVILVLLALAIGTRSAIRDGMAADGR